MEHMHVGKLCKWSFGLAGGVASALFLIVVGVAVMQFGMGQHMMTAMTTFYPGFAATWPGIFKSALCALIGNFIFWFVFAWLYNFYCCCFKKKCCPTTQQNSCKM